MEHSSLKEKKDFEIIHSGFFPEKNIKIEVKSGTRKYPLEIVEKINASWISAKEKDAFLLFNGIAYSLLSSEVSNDNLNCQIQKTDYKAFFGTNICNRKFIDDENQLANSLAVCSVIETSDNLFPIGMRSENVAEARHQWHTIGGNIEELPPKESPPYSYIKKELFEEGNIREDYIEELICTGLGRNLHTNKPEFLFYCKLNIDSETLKKIIYQAEDFSEHTHYVYLQKNELPEFLEKNDIVPIGRAVFHQYIELMNKASILRNFKNHTS